MTGQSQPGSSHPGTGAPSGAGAGAGPGDGESRVGLPALGLSGRVDDVRDELAGPDPRGGGRLPSARVVSLVLGPVPTAVLTFVVALRLFGVPHPGVAVPAPACVGAALGVVLAVCALREPGSVARRETLVLVPVARPCASPSSGGRTSRRLWSWGSSTSGSPG